MKFFERFDYVSSSSMNYVKFSKHLKKISNDNVFIDFVKSFPEKPTSSITELLNSSSKHPQRSRDRGLKKFPKITGTPTIKNRVRSPSPASSDSSPDSSHRSSSSRPFCFSYSIPSWRFSKSPSSSPERSQSRSRSRSRSKSPNILTNQGHRNGGNASAQRDSASFLNKKFPMPEVG